MDRTLDLDEAAAEIVKRLSGWLASGLSAGPVTWRDEAAPWPWRLETDRSLVVDPDSVGVRIVGPNQTELEICLFRGGWADVGYYAGGDDGGMIPASDLTSVSVFAALLDTCVARVFGEPDEGRRRPSPAP